ncbi:MAG TPA: TOBE domain-containing protein [Pseudonocardiaceae bacterium]|jgi:molybdopterin-binding protein|nr:TOBE domain-containing protein [Pseudonocardiaceae bacterium]
MSIFSIDEAARLIGVSDDTLRRWADAGQLATIATKAGQRGVDGAELARFATSLNTAPSDPVAISARNEFPGLVTRVIIRDHVMAQVEIQAGPHRIVSLMPVEIVDKLKLKPGIHAVASVKFTNVMVRPNPTTAQEPDAT